MDQRFCVAYQIASPLPADPVLFLSLSVDGVRETVTGRARITINRVESISFDVSGQFMLVDHLPGARALALSASGARSGSPPLAFNLLLVQPSVTRPGQASYGLRRDAAGKDPILVRRAMAMVERASAEV